MDVFAGIDRDAPIIVAEAVWQYSHHVLPGLRRHRGPILTAANWQRRVAGPRGDAQHQRLPDQDGPRLQLHLERDMTDDFADEAIGSWIETGTIEHDTSHVRDLDVGPPGRRMRPRPGGASRASWPTGWPSWASSTKAAWACTTPSSMTSTSTRWASTRSA